MLVSSYTLEVAPWVSAVDKYFHSMFRMEVGKTHIGLKLPDIEVILADFTKRHMGVTLTVSLDYRKRTYQLRSESGQVERLPRSDRFN